MFYCDKCAEERNWPETMCKSGGGCEICGVSALCNDRPSRLLPVADPMEVLLEGYVIGKSPVLDFKMPKLFDEDISKHRPMTFLNWIKMCEIINFQKNYKQIINAGKLSATLSKRNDLR